MTTLLLAASADTASKLVANLAVWAVIVACFAKCIQILFFKKKNPQNPK